MLGKKKSSKFDKYRTKEEIKPEVKRQRQMVYRVIAIILVLMVLVSGVRFYEHVQLTKSEKQWEQTLDKENDRTDDLNKEKKKLTTREYIEKIAREKLGLFYDDEYVLEDEESSTESSTSSK